MPILKAGSRTEFPKGGFTVQATVKNILRIGSAGAASATLAAGIKQAAEEFHKEFGRNPDWEKVLFRGAFVTNGVIVEICEPNLLAEIAK